MRKILIAAAMLAALSPPSAHGQEVVVKGDIIKRCRAQMGEYGAALVKVCVEEDIKAAAALSEYLEAARPIMQRCWAQMGDYGWSLVKVCVDEDLKAELALQELEGGSTGTPVPSTAPPAPPPPDEPFSELLRSIERLDEGQP
jgi:hypothetical protein